MSSQTTETLNPRSTTTTTRSRIAPEQLPKLTRTRKPKQISVSATHNSTRRIPTLLRHAKQRTIFRPFRRGSVAISPHQRRRLEQQYTRPAPRTNPPPHPTPHPQTPRHHKEARHPGAPFPGRTAISGLCAVRHLSGHHLSCHHAAAARSRRAARRRALNTRRAGNRMVAGPSSSPWLQGC